MLPWIRQSQMIFRLLQVLVIGVTSLAMVAVYWASQRLEAEATHHWQENANRVAGKTTEIFVYWLEFRRQKVLSIANSIAAYPIHTQEQFSKIIDRFTQDEDGQTQLQLVLLQLRKDSWQYRFDYGFESLVSLNQPVFMAAIIPAIQQASTLKITSFSSPIIDGKGHAQIAMVHPLVTQNGELQMLVSVFDIGELLSSLQKIHVPSGVSFGLTLKPNAGTQTRSVLHIPSSKQGVYHYKTTEDWWSGVWDFDWYVQSHFIGGVDLSLTRSVRWGGELALLLLGILVLALLEYARRLLLEMRQRQDVQRALAVSEQRLSAIANQLPGVVYRSRAVVGRPLVYISEPVEQLVGISAQQLLAEHSTVLALIHPEDRARVQAVFLNALEQGGSFDVEYRLQQNSGPERWILDHGQISALYPQEAYVDGIWLDVTERRVAQDALAQALEALKANNETLEQRVQDRTHELQLAMQQLVQSEKLASLGSLVAGMAHELNTPVGNTMTMATSMKSRLEEFTQAIASGSLRKSVLEAFVNEAREAMQLIESNTRRAADLVSNFKQVAIDQTSMRARRFDLMEIIEETMATLKPMYKHKPHQIVTDIQGGISLNSYPGALEQVIVNLMQNALIHGLDDGKPGRIDLRGGQSLNYAWVEVVDNGRGIPAHILPHIFDPFFTTRLGQGGSGLGLYITYNLVKGLLGGELSVTSHEGGGTCFRVQIPLVAPVLKENKA